MRLRVIYLVCVPCACQVPDWTFWNFPQFPANLPSMDEAAAMISEGARRHPWDSKVGNDAVADACALGQERERGRHSLASVCRPFASAVPDCLARAFMCLSVTCGCARLRRRRVVCCRRHLTCRRRCRRRRRLAVLLRRRSCCSWGRRTAVRASGCGNSRWRQVAGRASDSQTCVAATGALLFLLFRGHSHDLNRTDRCEDAPIFRNFSWKSAPVANE